MPRVSKPDAPAAATVFLSLGWAAVSWIEHYLVHGPGDVQGERIELDDEFAAFIVKAYRVHARSGARIVRRAFLSRPKGRSKSGLAAMIECFEALGPCRFDHWAEAGEVSAWGYEYEPGEPVGAPLRYVECLNVATEEGQAGNTYDAVYYMLHPDTCADALLADYGRIDVGLTRILMPDQRGFIQSVATKDTSNDGGKSTFIVADETHLWILPRLVRLHGVMTRNLMKRKVASGWMLETSTMYAEGEGSVAEGTHAYSKLPVAAGGKLLFDHREAPDIYDLTKRRDRLAALKYVYGPAAAWMDLEEMADAWDDPQVVKAEWIRYWLNRPVPLLEPEPLVIPLNVWRDRLAEDATEDPPAPHVGRVVLGIDADPGRRRTTITACGLRANGLPLLEIVENLPGVDWAADAVTDYCGRNQVGAVVIDKRSGAATLLPKLIKSLALYDVWVLGTDAHEYAVACGEFFDAVTETGQVEHLGDLEWAAALMAALKRPIGDAWGWDRRNEVADITPLTSGTLALYGHQRAPLEAFIAPQRLR